MINIEKLRQIEGNILCIGSHPGIIQSMLDFDYLSGKKSPSIKVIIATGRKFERYFFGKREVLIPVYTSVDVIPLSLKESLNLFLNVSSARRVLSSVIDAFEKVPTLMGGVVFAEDVPEKHALELYEYAQKNNKFVIGPASVGLLLPGRLKLGAIGGVDYRQLVDAHLFTKGSVAVFSASGGMTNEIINIVTNSSHRLSFSLQFGGDRFPIVTPQDAFLMAEKDPETQTIVYYGELGGFDEYEIAELLKEKKITKKVICYIAGSISEYFETPPQFGHAKAMATRTDETARAKRDALKKGGALVAESFGEFVEMIKSIQVLEKDDEKEYTSTMEELKNRRHALITTGVSGDKDGNPTILGEDLLAFSKENSFGKIVISMFLGKKAQSKELEEFVDFVLRLLVDHGPYVSGAVNTIVTARAGRDLVSSLSAGLLTIGPRFGGAINQAANTWLMGVTQNKKATELVEEFASKKMYISGIGHRKYRVDLPDPRVTELLEFVNNLEAKRFTTFAKDIQKVTTAKKGNLILNVDGAIAAVLLDLLSEKEGYTDEQLQGLVDTEFFNALFVISRSVGFISHFLDQKRLDEGLFRLEEDMVANTDSSH
jgi:succinyl-CoA synthetase alpha subunit